MLQAMRNLKNAWIAKFLIILIIICLIAWRLPSILGGINTGNMLISTDNSQTSQTEYSASLNQTIDLINSMRGADQLSITEIYQAQIPQAVYQQLVQTTLIDSAVADLQLHLSEKGLGIGLSKMRGFYDMTGKFNRAAFYNYLDSISVSKDTYYKLLYKQLLRDQLLTSVLGNVDLPKYFYKLLLTEHTAIRDISYLELSAPPVASIKDPDEKTLHDWFLANNSYFTAPETRTVTYFIVPKDTTGKDPAAYDKLYKQMNDNRNDGANIYDLAKDFKFTTISSTIDIQGKNKDGQSEKLPTEAFAANIFQLNKQDANTVFIINQPNQTIWYQLDKIDPAHPQTLEQAKDKAIAKWKIEEQLNLLKNKAESLINDKQTDLTNIAKAQNVDLSTLKQANIQQIASTFKDVLSADQIQQILQLTNHSAIALDSKDGTKVVLLKINNISLPQSTSDEALPTNLTKAGQKSISSSLSASFLQYLQREHPIKVNQNLLDQLLTNK